MTTLQNNQQHHSQNMLPCQVAQDQQSLCKSSTQLTQNYHTDHSVAGDPENTNKRDLPTMTSFQTNPNLQKPKMLECQDQQTPRFQHVGCSKNNLL